MFADTYISPKAPIISYASQNIVWYAQTHQKLVSIFNPTEIFLTIPATSSTS